MNKKYLSSKSSAETGQALIILIVAISIALLVITSAILRSISQAKISALNKLGQTTYYATESGAEYGLIRIMRDPNGCSGSDILSIDSVTVDITYTINGNSCLITSKATKGSVIKKIEVLASYDSGWLFNYSNWSEIP